MTPASKTLKRCVKVCASGSKNKNSDMSFSRGIAAAVWIWSTASRPISVHVPFSADPHAPGSQKGKREAGSRLNAR